MKWVGGLGEDMIGVGGEDGEDEVVEGGEGLEVDIKGVGGLRWFWLWEGLKW